MITDKLTPYYPAGALTGDDAITVSWPMSTKQVMSAISLMRRKSRSGKEPRYTNVGSTLNAGKQLALPCFSPRVRKLPFQEDPRIAHQPNPNVS